MEKENNKDKPVILECQKCKYLYSEKHKSCPACKWAMRKVGDSKL